MYAYVQYTSGYLNEYRYTYLYTYVYNYMEISSHGDPSSVGGDHKTCNSCILCHNARTTRLTCARKPRVLLEIYAGMDIKIKPKFLNDFISHGRGKGKDALKFRYAYQRTAVRSKEETISSTEDDLTRHGCCK